MFKEVGVTNNMVMDGAKSYMEGETKWVCERVGCDVVELEKNTPCI